MYQRVPKIIPIKDLRNTAQISETCHNSEEPIYITKNGYADMVIMSIEAYEKKLHMAEVFDLLERSEEDAKNKKVSDAFEHIQKIREKYGL